MLAVFYLTFNVIGAFLQDLLAMGIDKLTVLVSNLLTTMNVNAAVKSLVVDGIFKGVGSILSFLPIIVTLLANCCGRRLKTLLIEPLLLSCWLLLLFGSYKALI